MYLTDDYREVIGRYILETSLQNIKYSAEITRS